MKPHYAHTRGDTFAVLHTFPDLVLEDWGVRAQLRTTTGRLVADLGVQSVDAHRLVLTTADTNHWPVTVLVYDLQLTHKTTGVVFSFPRIYLQILGDITQ